MPEYFKIRREYLKIKRTYCARRAAYRSRLTCLSLKGRLLTSRDLLAYLSKKINFRECAATLPHIARKAFVQGVCHAVAATKSMVANGIFDQNAAKKEPIFDEKHCFFDEKSAFLISIIRLGSLR